MTDVLASLSVVATRYNYVKPHINEKGIIRIKNGRHPVIEKQLPIGEKYIANDVVLDSSSQQIIIITGPNMAGKSTYMRQTALITLWRRSEASSRRMRRISVSATVFLPVWALRMI